MRRCVRVVPQLSSRQLAALAVWQTSRAPAPPVVKIFFIRGIFLEFFYEIQHRFICRPSDSIVSEDAGFEPRTVATTALAVRRSNTRLDVHQTTRPDNEGYRYCTSNISTPTMTAGRFLPTFIAPKNQKYYKIRSMKNAVHFLFF
jgi:hypothetical protein